MPPPSAYLATSSINSWNFAGPHWKSDTFPLDPLYMSMYGSFVAFRSRHISSLFGSSYCISAKRTRPSETSSPLRISSCTSPSCDASLRYRASKT